MMGSLKKKKVVRIYICDQSLMVLYNFQIVRTKFEPMKPNTSFSFVKYSQKYKQILEKPFRREYLQKEQLKQGPVKPQPKQNKLSFFRIRSIGVGSFSFVRMVTQQNSGTLFAQKSINKKQIAPELATQIKLHFSLRHPNIVNLYHIYSDQTYVQLIMDYAGSSLFELRKNKKLMTPMPEYQIVPILRQLISAVAYIHSKKIVHSDIKLQNILYFEGLVKLCDFGFAHFAKDEQRTFQNPYQQTQNYKPQLVGTLEYLAPEYAQQRPSQFPRDIWAIGIVAYELAVGRNPFDGMRDTEKWQLIMKLKQVNLSNLGVSERYHKFLERALCPIQKRANITQLQNHELFFNSEFAHERLLQKWQEEILK